jgi:hypothetical protein
MVVNTVLSYLGRCGVKGLFDRVIAKELID